MLRLESGFEPPVPLVVGSKDPPEDCQRPFEVHRRLGVPTVVCVHRREVAEHLGGKLVIVPERAASDVERPFEPFPCLGPTPPEAKDGAQVHGGLGNTRVHGAEHRFIHGERLPEHVLRV